MRTSAEICHEEFGVSTIKEAQDRLNSNMEAWRNREFHLSIPYIADSYPESPSAEEIQKAMKENTLHAKCGMNYVFRVRDMVVKISDQQIIEEAENMIYLAKYSKVRVPKVYSVQRTLDGPVNQYAMISEFIEGFELSYEHWMGFTEEERTTLCARIGEQFRLLRSIPSEGYYGRIYHQAFDRMFQMFRTNCNHPCGPYDTYEEFAAAVIRSGETCALVSILSEKERLPEDVELLLSEYKLALETSTAREPFFTHVDPGPKNTVVRRIPGTQDHAPDWEVTLIDWAGAGWFPAWVQGACFKNRYGITDIQQQKLYPDLANHIVSRFYSDMECGAELVRIAAKGTWGIPHGIY